MANRLGFQAITYRNKASYASPDWGNVRRIRDNVLSIAIGEWDASNRGGGGFEEFLPTLIGSGAEFSLLQGTSAADLADFNAFRDAALNRTPIEMLILDGTISVSGVQGLRVTMAVFSFTRNEALRDGIAYDVSVKPTPADNPPQWITY